ncbi:MAG: sensor histidine kinase [Phenylobacterium sp.]|nr:MAG: sensor histidine kinase [Phenylobacterium sp.]
MLLALGWSLTALVVSAVVLALLFQQEALRQFDLTLTNLIDNLTAGTTVEQGDVDAPALTDERALRAYSGRYWEIGERAPNGALRAIVRSRSLWDSELHAPPDLIARLAADPAHAVGFNTRGPLNEHLRAVALQSTLSGRPLIFLAAEDRSPIDRDVSAFIGYTAGFFLLLGAGLVAAVIVQVRIGLRPLFTLRREIADVRRGRAERIEGDFPTELTPLTEELNALMAHNHEVVERQRTHVGNLAHALKTPISVMITEAAQRPGPLAEVVSRQAEVMRQHVDHHLRRARAAARSRSQGERTDVSEVLDELARTLERIFIDKGVAIDWDADEDLAFLGERQDLMEIAGNAMENACKWCAAKVRVRAHARGADRMDLSIEDDGPGLPPDKREAVVRRGARLDEDAPGSGLGLSILDELARAYRGELKLGDSSLGGLRVDIELPRAAA